MKVILILIKKLTERIKKSNSRYDFILNFGVILYQKNKLLNQVKENEKEKENKNKNTNIFKQVNILPNKYVTKKKKIRKGHNIPTVMVRNLDAYFVNSGENMQKFNDDTILLSCLSQKLGEEIIDIENYQFCNRCLGDVQLEYVEKPPSLCCPKCGIKRDIIDIYLSSAYEKDNNTHVPFTYTQKTYFNQWLKRITGKCKANIDKDDLDAIYVTLYNKKIFNVMDITWNVIDEIVRYLSRTKGKRFSKLYPLVYSITDIIRGKPLLVLSGEDIKELRNLFPKILNDWEKYVSKEIDTWIDRTNFLSNPIILQLCFWILGYPIEIISMFKQMKGDENMNTYQIICTKLCDRNGWKPFSIRYFADIKHGQQQSINELVEIE